MSFSDKIHALTRAMGKAQMRIGAKAPTALTVFGIGSLLTAGVLAAKATPRLEPIVEEMDREAHGIRSNSLFDEEAKQRALVKSYAGKGVDILKIYGPSLAMAALGTVSILYAHGLMKKRQAALVAAYGVLERSYNAYRERVRESFGENVDRDLSEGKVIGEVSFDEKNNVVKYETKESENYSGRSEYAVEFGPSNPNWNGARPEYNLYHLRSREKYMNQLLTSRGHVTLNDVYDALNVPRTPAGQIVGWKKDGPDGFVDFGLYEPGSPEEQDYFYYFNGEVSILLDFNVDGPIWDKL